MQTKLISSTSNATLAPFHFQNKQTYEPFKSEHWTGMDITNDCSCNVFLCGQVVKPNTPVLRLSPLWIRTPAGTQVRKACSVCVRWGGFASAAQFCTHLCIPIGSIFWNIPERSVNQTLKKSYKSGIINHEVNKKDRSVNILTNTLTSNSAIHQPGSIEILF